MKLSTTSSQPGLAQCILLTLGLCIALPGTALASQSHEQVKAEMAQASKITIEQAIQTASAAVSGTVIKAELEKEHGPLMWEIEIVTPQGQVKEVHLDGESGKRLALHKDEGSQQIDSAIHTDSAKKGNPKMKDNASKEAEAADASMRKNP